MNHLTIILKPTGRCNAACRYCSAWEPGKNGKTDTMSEETLEILFEKIDEWVGHSKQSKRVKLIWHGGEPTLMPLDFFYKAVRLREALEKSHGNRLHMENNIQTNLLFLGNEKLAMLKALLSRRNGKNERNGKPSTIGTSFDPLTGIRLLKGGDYNREWEKSIALLKENDFPFGIVYVVHKKSIQHIDRVVDTFLEKFPGTGIRFNPLYKEGKAANNSCDSLYITPVEWGNFLVLLYRIWERHDKKPSWQPLLEMEEFHSGKTSRLCCDYAGRCALTHLGIDSDGEVYSCGRGIDRKYKSYGNIHNNKISEILKSGQRMEMINRAVFLQNTHCKECKWWRYCHGGCPMDAAIANENDIFKKSNFCTARHRFLKTIYKEPIQ
ncbi:MAG: radical SAM protein [bacterium]|nr:radical SAM protein [bacterium]